MALFKIFKGLKDNLPKTYNDGYCYVTIDDGKMYIDTTNTENGRIVLNASHADTATMANKLDCDKVGTHEIPIYFDGGIPTACNYNFKDFLPLSAGENKKLTGALGLTENIMYGPKAPESGFEGQLFFIEDNSDPLPKGGKTNQVLVKNSETDGDASWQDKAPAAIAADKLTSNAGSSTLPVYFSGGVPVATGDSLDVNITKNAATATKLATTRALAITDADGTNKGTGFNFDGSTGGTFKLPATIKANITGSISGNAASADKLNNDAGDSSTPVYFSGGVPVACTSLDLNTSGNAATATKLKTARTISISDNDGTNTATGTSFNGSADITVKLPTTIKANLTGNADTATTADKLSVNGGNAETPIYFDAGVPSSCASVKLPKIQGTNAVVAGESTGSFIAIQPEEIMVNKVAEGATTGEQFSLTSAKLKKLNTLSTASVGSTSSPVYFNGGTVTECGDSLDVDITGNAASADKLTVNGGDSNTPVYFAAGVPTPCTDLDLDTSGNAATATQWKNARNFYISDSDGTNTGVATSVNGTDNATIKLPETIKATLSGKATSAGVADKLDANGGSATVPVYFDAGVPTPCTSLSLDTTGNAATATNVAWSGVTSKPSYYDAKAIKSISRSGTTFTATHLDGTTSTFDQQDNNSDTKVTQTVTTTNANYPLLLAPSGQTATTTTTSYFDSGVTLNPNTNTIAANISGNAATATTAASCSGNAATATVAASCSGNAATATNVAWSGITGKPSSFTPSAHTHDYLPFIGGTLTGGLTAQAGITLTGSDLILGCYSGNNKNDSSDIVYQYSNATEKCRIWTQNEYTSYRGPEWRVYKEDGTALGNGHLWASGESITGAVWNDYAECRESDCYEAGYVLSENGDDTLSKTNERLVPFAGVSSDTWGFSQGETDKAKTHIAVAGRVLVHPFQDRNNYKPGDCVCAAPGGTVDIMTREEVREWPDRIVGTVSCVPEYETWGGGKNADRNPVQVNGRIWIKVK